MKLKLHTAFPPSAAASLPLACALALGSIQSAIAVDRTWLGTTDSNWSNSTNWSPSGTMSSGDTAVLDGTATSGRSPDQNTGLSFEKILFKGTAGQAYTPGFGSWTLAGASTTTFIEVESGNNFTNFVNPDRGSGPLITLKSGNNTILNNGGGTLTISSSSGWSGNAIRANGSGNSTLIVDGSGTTYLATASNPVFKLADNGARVLSLTKIGDGTLHLESANTYSGLTTVTAGVLKVTNGDALGATGLASRTEISGNENTGRLELSGGISTGETFRIGMRQNAAVNAPALSNLSGNNTVTGDIEGVTGGSRINIESQAGLLTLAGNLRQTSGTSSRTWQLMGAGDGLVSGVISNGTATNLGIIKSGAGTWTLSNTNTYTGTTSVSAGTLAVSSAGSINTISGISVAAGAQLIYNSSTALTVSPALNGAGTSSRAVLGGTGPINAAITLNDLGDTLAPGNSPGIQTFTPAQTWSSFSYDWELNNFITQVPGTNHDQLSLASTLELNGGVGAYQLNVLGLTAGNLTGAVPDFTEANQQWTILTSVGAITGFDAANWTINTSGFSNNTPFAGNFTLTSNANNVFLNYTVIPEPSAALLGSLGVLVLLRRRRA